MPTTSLVVGGTGVSGSYMVQGLLDRGHEVTVLNTGRTVPTPEESPWYHDAANGPTKLTGGVDRAEDLDTTLAEEFGADWAFDHVFVTYGKLRATAPLFVGRCGRFYSAGGMVTHDTWGTADDSDTRTVSVRGQAIPPHTEDTPHMTADGTTSGEPQSFNPKLNKIIESEAVVFAHHPNAFHVRYGNIYGGNNILPAMWSVVKRILDGRTRIIVSMEQARLPRSLECFGRNAAEYFMLAVDNPETSQGESFNGTEDTMPTTVQWIYMVAEAMGRQDNVEVVEMPDEIAAPFRPLNQGENDGLRGPHIHFNEKAHRLLGYKDVVGKREAIKTTADWMVANQEKVIASAKISLQEPFDYENEDRLLEAWDRRDYQACLAIDWGPQDPGWGHFYYGKMPNPGDEFGGDLEKKYAGSYDRETTKRVAGAGQPPQPKL